MSIVAPTAVSKLETDLAMPTLEYMRRRWVSGNLTLGEAVSFYEKWVNQPLHIHFERNGKNERFLASKRGNPSYARKVRSKFNRLLDKMPQQIEEDVSDTVFLSLTNGYSASILDYWNQNQKHVQTYMYRVKRFLRKYFNIEKEIPIDYIRNKEAHQGGGMRHGTVHNHLSIQMPEKLPYKVVSLKKGKKETHFIDSHLEDKLKELWSWGKPQAQNVQAMTDIRGGLKYQLKYMLKASNNDSKEPPLTLAMLVLNKQRGFTMSRGFSELSKPSLDDPLSKSSQKCKFLGLEFNNDGILRKKAPDMRVRRRSSLFVVKTESFMLKYAKPEHIKTFESWKSALAALKKPGSLKVV